MNDSAPSPVSSLPFAVLALLAAILISCLSGFHATDVPAEIKWQLSPLGLLFNFNPDFLEMETLSSFSGKLGLHFDYLLVFLKTCALEAPFYFLIFRRQGWVFVLAALLFANALTHPAIYFLFPAIFKGFLTYALSAEVFAPTVEALFAVAVLRHLRQAGAITAVALIVLANLFSWQMGAWV